MKRFVIVGLFLALSMFAIGIAQAEDAGNTNGFNTSTILPKEYGNKYGANTTTPLKEENLNFVFNVKVEVSGRVKNFRPKQVQYDFGNNASLANSKVMCVKVDTHLALCNSSPVDNDSFGSVLMEKEEVFTIAITWKKGGKAELVRLNIKEWKISTKGENYKEYKHSSFASDPVLVAWAKFRYMLVKIMPVKGDWENMSCEVMTLDLKNDWPHCEVVK